mgnify:CR=1 FL=1
MPPETRPQHHSPSTPRTKVHPAPPPQSSSHALLAAIKDVYEESASFQEILNKFEPADYAVCELQPDQRNELGRSTWALLHIMASSYPANPPPNVIFEHLLFFQLLPKVYPCPECRVHMAKMFAEFPPQLETQQQFTRWLCEAHNRVNARIGKPIVNCDEMDSRWDCGCNIVPGEGENVDNAPQVPNADWNSRPSRSSKSKRKHRS